MDVGEMLQSIKPRYDYLKFLVPPTSVTSQESVVWRERFVRDYVDGDSENRDDLLFYVKYDEEEEEQTVLVQRKSGKTRGPPESSTIWDQTFYLNLILHEFEYYATCAIITLKPGGDRIEEIITRISHQVYPSPNQRRMDENKGDCDSVYPNIVFSVDSFEETFSSFHVRKPGQKVAIQLLAVNKRYSVSQVVFLGAVDYRVLLEACSRKKPFGSKLKRISSSLKRVHTARAPPYQFVQVRGPFLKGFAELALSKVTAPHELTPRSGTQVSGGAEQQPKPKYSPELRGVLKLDPPEEELGPRKTAEACTSGSTEGKTESRCVTQDAGGGGGWEEGSASGSIRGVVVYSHYNGIGGAGKECMPEFGNPDPEVSAELLGGKKASKFKIPKLPKLKKKSASSTPPPPPPLYTYLTYIRLPWYYILDDILNGSNQSVL